jgi:nudix-type nucleoside diphosphatase (YffH/AdpP family)
MKIESVRVTHERWARMLIATVRTEDGQSFERDIEDHGDAAGVLPFDPARRVALLIRQVRAPCLYRTGDGLVLELPAGRLEGETPEACARREAMEETGLALKSVDQVAQVWGMAGLSTEQAHLFLAEYDTVDRVSAGGGLAHENESMLVVEVPLSALAAMADRGELMELKLLLLVQTLRLRRPELFG